MAHDRHDQPRPDEGEALPAFPPDDLPLFFSDESECDACDCFAPPAVPCECYCLHCGRLFMSDQIWFQRVINADDGFAGFWMCPTPNCDGKGFTFDIFPTDPGHPANADVEDGDDDLFDDEIPWEGEGEDSEESEYDPAEPEYASLDEGCLDDMEGEEWKYGLAPGDPLPEPEWRAQARAEWAERQQRFAEPDERPREIDISETHKSADEMRWNEDDIPF